MGSKCYWAWVSLGGDKMLRDHIVVIVAYSMNTLKTTELYTLI